MDTDTIEPSADFSAGEEGPVECNKDNSDAQQCIMDQQPVPASEDSVQNTTADQIDENVDVTNSGDASSQPQDGSEDRPLDQLAEVAEQASAAEPMETEEPEGEVAEMAEEGEDQVLDNTGEAEQPESESVEQENVAAPSEQMFAETGEEDGAGIQDLPEAVPISGNVEAPEEALPAEPDHNVAADFTEREAEDGAVGDAGGDNFCNISAEEEDKLLADDGREGEEEGVSAVGQDSDQPTAIPGSELEPDTDVLKDPEAELMDAAEENETVSPEKIEVNTSSETEGAFENNSELTENVESQHCVEENTQEDPELEGTESESVENSAEKEDTKQLADEQEQSTEKGDEDDEKGNTNSDSAVTETDGDGVVQPVGASNESDVTVKEDRTVVISDDVVSPVEAETSSAPCQDTKTAASHNTSSSSSVTVPSTQAKPRSSSPVPVDDDDDDDVVVLDDYVSPPKVKEESLEKEVFNNNNDMGIQIASVSGGAEELHKMADQNQVKQENGDVLIASFTNLSSMKSPATMPSGTPSAKKSTTKSQNCIVCKRVGKCKYNIVRNGDVKHLCDDTCFKRFRTNPSMFLKGSSSNRPVRSTAGSTTTPQMRGRPPKARAVPVMVPVVQTRNPTPSLKTCVVCQIMNVNNQGQFCTWKGMDFCGEGCLGKFQSGISTSCTLCKMFIPLTARSSNCLKLGNQIQPFCSTRCYSDYKRYTRLCTFCHNDLGKTMDSFSAPVGPDSTFKEFCSQDCMRQFESLLNSDVEIIKVEQGRQRSTMKCSVCSKLEKTKHAIKFAGVVHPLCSDTCLSAFRYANKLDLNTCHFCKAICSSLESTPHTVIFEGDKKRFCSDACVCKYRLAHRKVVPCSWCGSLRDNFDMIERLDSHNKYQLFCSLNCLSLFRVNLQAKSNQAVMCDFCRKMVPAQYHLTMSDASVRNFCSYNCVMSFQSQFTTAASSAPLPPSTAVPLTTHKHNTRRSSQQPSTTPPVPIISNVISLAPQGNQTVNTKNSAVSPVVSKVSPVKKTSSRGTSPPVNQKVIIQPPPPKVMKNKALMCKPFTQTKVTSCRPHATTKECQTEVEVRDKPIVVPVPVPIYLPSPMALYSTPAPTPIFIPVPIPVPVFIPTTRKSAKAIMKQIKEIEEKTPSDPLEAELLQMAAAVSGEGTIASESDAEEDEPVPEISKSRKRPLPMEEERGEEEEEDGGGDDDDALPLTNQREDGEEDMISMALRMAEEITDLEAAVEAVPVSSEAPRMAVEDSREEEEEEPVRSPRITRRNPRGVGRTKRPRLQAPAEGSAAPVTMTTPEEPAAPPADLNYHLKFSYGVSAWKHWVMFKNTQLEQSKKAGVGRVKFFKTDILQCTADELNFSLCLFVKEVRKPNGDEYSPDSIYYLTLGLQEYLYENGRIDNIFADHYYEPFTQQLTEILSTCQPKFNSEGQMVCRIEEEHLWECKQLGAHSPYVLLNTLIFFHTKFFMLKTPEEHLKLSFAHILKYWKKGHQPGKGGQASSRSVSLRYYSISSARKDASAAVSTTKRGSKDGIPVYEVVDNPSNPLRCPVKLYEFFLSKCPESIKNRSDIFYPVPERSCVPDSPVWYSTMPLGEEVMTRMLTRILLVREIQEAHLHSRPIYV